MVDRHSLRFRYVSDSGVSEGDQGVSLVAPFIYFFITLRATVWGPRGQCRLIGAVGCLTPILLHWGPGPQQDAP